MSRNGIGNFNASDIIRRNQERMLMVAKMRNDYAKQQSLTIQPLQSGQAGGGPISAQFIPKMRQAAATALTVEEYTTILNGIITELGGGQTGGGGGGGGYSPTGEPSVLYSLPYIVQGIVLDATSNRIILTYDLSNNQYYIYKTLSNDPSGNLTQMVLDNKILISASSKNKNMFLEKTTANNYYIASYSIISTRQYPTIVQYDSNFNYVSTKVIRDASGTIMTEGGINNLITVGTTIFCSGWFNNTITNSSYSIDSAIFPASSQTNRYVPFFIKLDSSLNALWAGTIIPQNPNSYGSACVADSQGNIYASVKVEGAGDTFADAWAIKTGNTTSASVTQAAQSIIAKYDSSNTYLINKQLIVGGFYSIGEQLGMQMFVDASDNIFVSYNIQFVNNTTNYTDNLGNSVSLTFNRATKSIYNAVIIKLNTSLVPQAAWQLEMPSNFYNLYIKSISFDPVGNLLVNAAYTTGNQAGVTIADNHGNNISLTATGSGFQNGMDISLSNDLTTVNWYFDISGIKTDEAMNVGFYRNNGKLIVDSTNNKLIKIDERTNTSIVSVSAGLSLPISSGTNTSFLIEYS
jgi:hypothetical protein